MRQRLALALMGVAACTFPAAAQTGSSKSTSALQSEINSLFPDQTTGAITPFDLRQVTLDITASFPNFNNTSYVVPSGTFGAGNVIIGASGVAIQDSGLTASTVSALAPLGVAGVSSNFVNIGPNTNQIQDSGLTAASISATAPLFSADTIGNVVVVGPNTVQVESSTTVGLGSVAFPIGLSFTSNIVYSGAQNSANAYIFDNGHTISGTGSGALVPYKLFIGSDTVRNTGSILTQLLVEDAPAAGHVGFRTAIEGDLEIVGSPGSGNNNYVGVLGQIRASANLGGNTTSYSAGSGSIFGYNANVFTTNGATGLLNLTAMELDSSVVAGSSVNEKHGFTVVKTGLDAVQGTFDDSAVEFDDQDATSVPWQYGISFGAYAHKWPFNTSSTLITIQNRVAPGANSSQANIGVDFNSGSFTTAAFRSPGFSVNPQGAISLSSNSGTVAGGNTTAAISIGTAAIGTYWGSGAPTISANTGSIYLRTDGSTTSTRMYVNTGGGAGWASVTTGS